MSRLGDLKGGYLASWPAPLVRSEVETTLTRTDIRNHLNTTENNCILKRKIYWIAKATTVFLYLYFCIWMSISGLLEYGLVDYNLMDFHLVDFHEWHSNREIVSEHLFSKNCHLSILTKWTQLFNLNFFATVGIKLLLSCMTIFGK